MIYLVSRHPGAITWCQRQGLTIDTVLPHIQPTIIKKGDVVIGTLPINLAAEVQQAGGGVCGVAATDGVRAYHGLLVVCG